jgi:iron complex transport system substrate-binding protein
MRFDRVGRAFYDPRAMGFTALLSRRMAMVVIGVAGCLATVSCERGKAGAPVAATHGRRIASLVPAATDMLVGLGAKDHLVAVSNFESLAEVKGLPRVGDYQTTDWEALARLRPDVMVIQIAPQRLPAGLKRRAEELGIELVNVKIDRLADVFATMEQLGAAAGEQEKGREAARHLRDELEAVRTACAKRAPVSALIVRDENGRDVIGPDNFLDDLLKVVNATNAAAGLGQPYPTIDRERLVALAPQAVIVLLPDAKAQTVEVSQRFWAEMTEVPAVKSGRVVTITDGYALVPGSRLGELARRMAEGLAQGDKQQESKR